MWVDFLTKYRLGPYSWMEEVNKWLPDLDIKSTFLSICCFGTKKNYRLKQSIERKNIAQWNKPLAVVILRLWRIIIYGVELFWNNDAILYYKRQIEKMQRDFILMLKWNIMYIIETYTSPQFSSYVISNIDYKVNYVFSYKVHNIELARNLYNT